MGDTFGRCVTMKNIVPATQWYAKRTDSSTFAAVGTAKRLENLALAKKKFNSRNVRAVAEHIGAKKLRAFTWVVLLLRVLIFYNEPRSGERTKSRIIRVGDDAGEHANGSTYGETVGKFGADRKKNLTRPMRVRSQIIAARKGYEHGSFCFCASGYFTTNREGTKADRES